MLAIKTVLHPTDFSGLSDHAFRLACSFARDHGARLIILHVIEPPMAVSAEGVLLASHIDWERIREQLLQVRPSDPNVRADHRLVEGDPVTEILRVAREVNCDLLVLGTHGRKGLGRLLMGSVAEQVLRRAPCPVVTVKAPLAQEKRAEGSAPPAAGRAAEVVTK
jgi:nucleotide-binding universal stress UspA family protein